MMNLNDLWLLWLSTRLPSPEPKPSDTPSFPRHRALSNPLPPLLFVARFRGQQLRRPTSSPRSLLLDLDFKVEHRNDPRWNRQSCATVKFQYHPVHFVFSTYFRESQVCRLRLFFRIWPLLQQALPVAEWLSWRSAHQKRWLRDFVPLLCK